MHNSVYNLEVKFRIILDCMNGNTSSTVWNGTSLRVVNMNMQRCFRSMHYLTLRRGRTVNTSAYYVYTCILHSLRRVKLAEVLVLPPFGPDVSNACKFR